MKKEVNKFLSNNRGYIKNIFLITVLIVLSILLFNSLNVNATPSIVALNFTDLLANQTIVASRDANITFNVTFDGENQHNVTLYFYNNTGITFVNDVNFTTVVNGSMYSYAFNESNYTKGDTIVVELKFWNGTDATYTYYSNISSYINGTNNSFLCYNNDTCEFQNLTEALFYAQTNQRNSSVFLLENNTNYSIDPAESTYILGNDDIGMQVSGGYNIIIDCNNSFLQKDVVGTCQPIINLLANSENITITNCNLMGPYYSTFAENAIDCIRISGSKNINVTKNHLHLCQGAYYGGGNSHINISYNYFNNSYYFVTGSDLDLNIFENTFTGNYSSGGNVFMIQIGNYATNVTIRDNNFTNMKTSPINIRADTPANTSVKIINNTFHNITTWSAITLQNFSNYIEISNNSFYGGISSFIVNAIELRTGYQLRNITIINNNFTRVNRALFCNETQYGYNITFRDNFVINSNYGIYCNQTWNLNNSYIYNNTFISASNIFNGENIKVVNNTFNNSGNQTIGYFANYVPLQYEEYNYTVVAFITGGVGGPSISYVTNNNSIISWGIANGTRNFDLFLLKDDSNALTKGAGANVTMWWVAGITDCATVAGAYGGTCIYENLAGTFYNGTSGTYPNYVFNDTNVSTTFGTPTINYNNIFLQTGSPIDLQGAINSNITGNKFYNTNTNMTAINDHPTSKNNTIWNNYFYALGFNQTNNNTGCYNKIGNYYTNYDTLVLANNECGLQVPTLSLSPSTPSQIGLHDIITLSCDGSDDMNLTSLELSVGVVTVCTSAPAGLLKSPSCSYDYEADSLGDKEVICTISDKATNQVVKTTTLTVKSTSTNNPSPTTSSGPTSVTITKEQEDITINKGTSITFSEDIGYSLKLNNILDNSVDFAIYSGNTELLTSNLEIGASREYDLDSDGINDILVTLNGIRLNNADLTIQKLAGIFKVKPIGTLSEETQKISKGTIIFLLIIIFVMATSLIGYYIYSQRK